VLALLSVSAAFVTPSAPISFGLRQHSAAAGYFLISMRRSAICAIYLMANRLLMRVDAVWPGTGAISTVRLVRSASDCNPTAQFHHFCARTLG